jgi:murein L,D-transpeptidase YcbB/YkuD
MPKVGTAGSAWRKNTVRMIRTVPIAAALAASGVAAQPTAARAATPVEMEVRSPLRYELEDRVDRSLREFYRSRAFRPLWMNESGMLNPAAKLLLRQIETSRIDAVKPGRLKPGRLAKALRDARPGQFEKLARAELLLSRTFAQYVAAMRTARRSDMIYETQALAPVAPTPSAALEAAAAQMSLRDYVARMGWMHPFYAPMREALLDRQVTASQRAAIWENLDRIRALPALSTGRYVLVDAASATLWMYENGKPVDSMRVVVGKAATPTPMMAGFLRFAIVNPYWNVPPDLVRSTVAWNVNEKGLDYLKAGGYQVLSDWSAEPELIDPATIDWQAVAAGTRELRVRQLPGGSNFMGKVKFEFPNPQGIYLHDSPNKELLRENVRQLSNGCVRLEDADRFGKWLLGKRLPKGGGKPEQRIDLAQIVPVYLTYLTAVPRNGRIVFSSDVYRRDAAMKLARMD